jgi:cyclopropane fatty-acyl-phospholipid synthase-like methyltransferase
LLIGYNEESLKLRIEKMVWDKQYTSEKKVWGEKPSELAHYAVSYLKHSSRFHGRSDLFVLDLGCGYGRDAVYLVNHLSCHILGLDSSEKALALSQDFISEKQRKHIELLCYDFTRVSDKYDVIFASNLYQIISPEKRIQLAETVKKCLKADGLFFLSTLSIRDPQHSGDGMPVENDPNTFLSERGTQVHLSTRQELETAFDFLNIHALFEREYDEPRSTEAHHHISWLLMGSLK